MNKVLITGANGFIGKSFISFLNHKNYEILVVTRKEGDVTDLDFWNSLPSSDYVVHLAGQNFVPDSWINSNRFLETNVLGTNLALDYCKRNRIPLIYVSAYLYGIPKELPITENHPIQPNNPYALSKYLAEQVCKFRADYFDQDVTVLRIFNVYGPGQRSEFLIPLIVEQFKKKSEIRILDKSPRRDFIYIDDVVESIYSAMIHCKGYSVYNVGSGLSYSVEEVINLCQEILNSNYPILSEGKERLNEIPDVIADISKIKKELGWAPKISMREGLRILLNS